jgi:hypothetical protein
MMMANCHYRLLRERIGNGYATARFQHIFLDFINAAANVVIGEHDIIVFLRIAPTTPCSPPLALLRPISPCTGCKTRSSG